MSKAKVIETWSTLNKDDFTFNDISTAMLGYIGMTFDQFLVFAQIDFDKEKNEQIKQVCIKNMLKKYDYLKDN